MRQKLLLLAAVFFGVLAFVLTYQQIKIEREKALGGARKVVLIIVKRDMTTGEKIKETDITYLQTKRFQTETTREITWDKRALIINRELAFPVEKNHALEWSDLKAATRGHEGLTKIIPMGQRAISIPVDATASVTGLINPNDHVDIIGTFRFPEMKGDKAYDTLTLTILQNVTVLATGTDYGKTDQSAQGKTQKAKSYSTITLALSPKEVEMIIFASQKGKLTLSLRNFEETLIETKLQSINFKLFEENIEKYNVERANTIKSRGTKSYNP